MLGPWRPIDDCRISAMIGESKKKVMFIDDRALGPNLLQPKGD